MKGIKMPLRFIAILLLTGSSLGVSARCGSVNYSWGADALHEMNVYVLVMMEYVLGLLYAVASLVALYSATGIYIKMQTGEEGIIKHILILVGAILFLISASIVLPAFFGINWG